MRKLVIVGGLGINEAARQIGTCTRVVGYHRDALRGLVPRKSTVRSRVRHFTGYGSKAGELNAVAVELAVTGAADKLAAPEMREAVRILSRRRDPLSGRPLSVRDIARRLGCADRTVTRWRKRLREAGEIT